VTGAALLLGLQMILGGLVSSSYAGLACADWPSCNDGVWFPSLRGPVGLQLAHRMNGYALVCLLAGAAVTSRRGADERGLAGWCTLALILAGVQVGVGVANVLLRLPVEVTGLHSALAAGIVLAVAGAARSAWRTGS
jgi:cytochrome c oxidase assembly protein subunit 15